ncbi:unnamed protein product [Camellia sinensis]
MIFTGRLLRLLHPRRRFQNPNPTKDYRRTRQNGDLERADCDEKDQAIFSDQNSAPDSALRHQKIGSIYTSLISNPAPN